MKFFTHPKYPNGLFHICTCDGLIYGGYIFEDDYYICKDLLCNVKIPAFYMLPFKSYSGLCTDYIKDLKLVLEL